MFMELYRIGKLEILSAKLNISITGSVVEVLLSDETVGYYNFQVLAGF